MIITKPYYYSQFKCIASKCSDSCCIGWEIDIDKESLIRFKNEKGALGERLSENIENQSFILSEDERCPFLYKNGLCELICKKGEGYICEICREHPRYHEWYGNHHDIGLGLCCEEVCRLLFQNEKSIAFICEEDTIQGEKDDQMIKFLLSLREDIIEKITNRVLPLSKRFEKFPEQMPSFEEILIIWDKLEPFDKRWNDTAEYIKVNFDHLIKKKDEFLSHIDKRVYEYEHLSVYLIHRYFMKSVYKYFPDSVLRGVAIYLGTQFLFDLYLFEVKGSFKFTDRIDTAKYISKQLEYSEKNIDIIMDS